MPNIVPKVDIKRPVYAMASTDGVSAEITMYGDIYEKQPVDYWGKPVDGQYILLSDFMADLENIAKCSSITIRMNSYGGDAGVSNTIHNRLRELSRDGVKLTCIVDGVAMSGGSLIMCACDTVKVNPSSLIMIHKCWSFLFGGYNADDMREAASQNDAWDKMQTAIYHRKTGLSETVLSHMMGETTYMTGREAVEKHFADELVEDADPVEIAASADGKHLFVHGRQMPLAPGTSLPGTIKVVAAEAPSAETNKKPVVTGENEGGISMTAEELREKYPEAVSQIEAAARQAASDTAINAAVQAEQERIHEIDEVASLYPTDMVMEAKYGNKACSAKELTYRAAVEAAKQGRKALNDMSADAKASGTDKVGAADPKAAEEAADPIAQARADAKAFNERNKKEAQR